MKVLIADDEQITRYALSSVLKQIWTGVVVKEARDLDEVVSLISVTTFDLVILDIQMPGNEGLEDIIRFMLAENKVIIFSGYEPTNSRIENLQNAGVNQFIYKSESLIHIKSKLLETFTK